MGDFLQELLQSHLAALNESEALSKKQENDLSIKKMELEYHATRAIQESEQFWAKAQVLASVLVKTEEAPERKEQQHDDSGDRVTIHSCQAKALDFLQEENRSASLRQSVSAIKEQIEKEEQITREYLKTLQENEIERLRNEQQQQQQAEMEARRQREAELLNTR